ncbi:MAG: FecR domain-containing protein [Prolixibacteraceae bacterium]
MVVNRRHIDKVFEQEHTLRDQKMLAKYFADKELNEESRQIIRKQWEHFEFRPDESPDLDHVFYKLYYQLNEDTTPRPKKIKFNFRMVQIAAILAVGIFIAVGLYLSRRNVSEMQVQFISANGFRNQFKLPDGSTGWLGSDSEIKYRLDKSNNRVVYLNGLAYFDVAHNGSPFIVETPKGLNIEVKGTQFNVSAYRTDPSCEVVLENGSVRLSDSRGLGEEMVPNDRIIYYPGNGTMEKSQVNTADFVAWIHGKLVMKDIPLKEALLKLSRFYNVEFEIRAAGTEQERVRLVLENESLDEALNLLAAITPISCHIQERRAINNDTYSKKKIIITNK